MQGNLAAKKRGGETPRGGFGGRGGAGTVRMWSAIPEKGIGGHSGGNQNRPTQRGQISKKGGKIGLGSGITTARGVRNIWGGGGPNQHVQSGNTGWELRGDHLRTHF